MGQKDTDLLEESKKMNNCAIDHICFTYLKIAKANAVASGPTAHCLTVLSHSMPIDQENELKQEEPCALLLSSHLIGKIGASSACYFERMLECLDFFFLIE